MGDPVANNGRRTGALADYLLQQNPRYSEMLDPKAVERLVASYRSRSAGSVQLLLSILMLEVWLSSFLPRALNDSTVVGPPFAAA